MEYAYKITTNGRAVMAACMDLGAPFRVTRVAFGKGLPQETENLADRHQLIDYVSDGAVTNRSHSRDRFEFTIQFANVQHPEVKTFLLSEFMVYVSNPETGEDTDLLYGTLGDYRQPVPGYNPAFPPSVFNFPLTVILSDELTVEISAAAGLVTVDAAYQLFNEHNADENAHAGLLSGYVKRAEPGTPGSAVVLGEDGKIPPDYLGEYAKILEPGTPGSAVVLDESGKIPSDYLSEYVKVLEPGTPGSAVVLDENGKIPLGYLSEEALAQSGVAVADITIPAGAWQPDTDGPGAYRAEVACEDALDSHLPYVSLDKPSMSAAESCGFCSITEAVNGALRFWADRIPEADLAAQAALLGSDGGSGGRYILPAATTTSLGGVKIKPGSGLLIDNSGNLSLDAANDSEVAAIFNGSKAE